MRVALCGALLAAALAAVVARADGQATGAADNQELKALFDQDQADRLSPDRPTDLVVRAKRDAERLKRVKELYRADVPQTGADWFRAALVLQHGRGADDILLAHEMALASLAKGEPRARWLVAATEDRFLRCLGRPQRFGTQYESTGGPMTLAETAPGVTDHLRSALGVPPLPAPGSKLHAQ